MTFLFFILIYLQQGTQYLFQHSSLPNKKVLNLILLKRIKLHLTSKIHHQEKNFYQEVGQGKAHRTYHFHRRQVHLLLSPEVLEQPLLARFGQQHAKACGRKLYIYVQCMNRHTADYKEHLIKL